MRKNDGKTQHNSFTFIEFRTVCTVPCIRTYWNLLHLLHKHNDCAISVNTLNNVVGLNSNAAYVWDLKATISCVQPENSKMCRQSGAIIKIGGGKLVEFNSTLIPNSSHKTNIIQVWCIAGFCLRNRQPLLLLLLLLFFHSINSIVLCHSE